MPRGYDGGTGGFVSQMTLQGNPSACSWKDCTNPTCKTPWHQPSEYYGTGFVARLRPIVLIVGSSETVVGTILLILLTIFAREYDDLFATERTKLISLTSFGGLFGLTVSGVTLLVAVLLNRQRIMWFYVLLSTFLCVYIFVLSVMQLHFALVVLRAESQFPNLINVQNQSVLSTACVIGMITLLGSVVHFTGTVTVFTYYNLKYIHPTMFVNGPN